MPPKAVYVDCVNWLGFGIRALDFKNADALLNESKDIWVRSKQREKKN